MEFSLALGDFYLLQGFRNDINIACAINAKILEVTFNKEIDATGADFTVNKGTVKTNVAAIAISEDKKTATIELTSKMTAGKYTVSVAQEDADALTESVEVEDEK